MKKPLHHPATLNGIRVYDEGNIDELLGTNGVVMAGEPRYLAKKPRTIAYGANPNVRTFENSGIDLIPESEWSARAAALKARQARVSDICDFKPLDQNGTNYCWANGVVNCMRVARRQAGLPFVDLSPASVAAPIKNYSNSGGWGQEALQYIRDNGVADVECWPPNAISRTYMNDKTKENYKRHQAREWFELEDRNFAQLASCLLQNVAVAVGYNWWSHEVMAVDLEEASPGVFTVLIWNSWGNWGDANSRGIKGFGYLSRSKATPDDACGIFQPTISLLPVPSIVLAV